MDADAPAGNPDAVGGVSPPGMEAATAATRTARDEAFATYVLPEIEVMLRVARHITRHDADAEDLVQDALLRAYKAVDRFDGRHPRAWLLTIVRNANINRNRRQRPGLLFDPDRTMETLAANADGPRSAEEEVVSRRFDAAIEESLADLDDVFRSVLILVDIEGLSYQEAADVLGVPVGTVMSRLHRARKRIRARLAKSDLVPRNQR